MKVLVKLIFIFSLLLGLIGCDKKTSVQDLLDHPMLLKKEMAHCQSAASEASDSKKQWCQLVLAAEARFMGMVADRETDPEKFGLRIIMAEEEYAAAKIQLEMLSKSMNELKAKNPAAVGLQKAQDQLIQARKNYMEKQQEVKLLLAVVGTSAPN